MSFERVLTRHWNEPESWTLANYLCHGGYQALAKALTMTPTDVIATVKESGGTVAVTV